MKLKTPKSIGHNAAHSYLSTVGHIGEMYTSTYLYRLALRNELSSLELDVLNASSPSLQDEKLLQSLQGFRTQFVELLRKEGIAVDAVKTYKLTIQLVGNRPDIIDIQCKPFIVDYNDKVHECALIQEKYPEPV